MAVNSAPVVGHAFPNVKGPSLILLALVPNEPGTSPRIVRELVDEIHLHEAAQPSGTAKIPRRVVEVEADAADLVGDGDLERERVDRQKRVGPDDELIE